VRATQPATRVTESKRERTKKAYRNMRDKVTTVI
jgi:hypothetical protein